MTLEIVTRLLMSPPAMNSAASLSGAMRRSSAAVAGCRAGRSYRTPLTWSMARRRLFSGEKSAGTLNSNTASSSLLPG